MKVACIAAAADVCEKGLPCGRAPKPAVQLVTMAMNAQPVDRWRIPEVWKRVILRMRFHRNIRVVAEHTCRGMLWEDACAKESGTLLSFRTALCF